MPTIGELVIDIKASTASIQTEMTKLQGTMATSSAAIVSSLNKIVDIMIIDIGQRALRGLASMVERTIEAGDRIGRLSIQTGLSTEALSKYAYAAKMADIDIETFSAGMSRLSFKLEEAAAGNKKLRADFQSFGIDATKIRDPEQALIKLNEAFSRLYEGDKARVIAASIEFFSRAGFRLLPFLTMAPEQLRTLTRELEQMGGVWDEKGVKTAEALHESLKRLDTVWEVFGKRLMMEAGPSIDKVLSALVNLTKNAGIFGPVIEAIGKIIGWLAVQFYLLVESIVKTLAELKLFASYYQTVIAPIGGNIKNIALAAATGGVEGGRKWVPIDWAGAAKGAEEYSNAIDASNTRIEQFKIMLKGTGQLSAETWKALTDGAGTAVQKQASDIDKIVKKLEDEMSMYGDLGRARLLMEAIDKGASTAQIERIAEMIDALEEMDRRRKEGLPQIGPLTPEQQYGLTGLIPPTTFPEQPALVPYNIEEMGDKARRMWQENLTPLEKYNLAMADTNDLYQAGLISAETYSREVKRLGEAYDKATKNTDQLKLLVTVQRDISQGFADAIFGADSFGDAMKRLLLRIAEVIFQAKVLDPLLKKLFEDQKEESGGGGGGGGGLFGSIGSFFGGLFHFQVGGRFAAGQPFVAGEAGPEIIYPGISDTVIPNHALGGNVYNIDARGADPTVEFRIRRALRESEQRSVARSVSTTREMGLRNVT